VISITDLEFRHGNEFCLRIPQLEIGNSSATAFIGPSGTGKTTLLHLIAGIEVPASGRVVTNGVEVSGLDDATRREFRIRNIGLVFQDFELLEYLDVLDNILLPYRLQPGLGLDENVRSRAKQLAVDLGVGEKLQRYPNQLSQGEKQRAALCRALVPQPAVILADEPTGNLDPANKKLVLDLIFDYLTHESERGVTLVTVTHDHELLDRFEDVVDFSKFH
jgi:ABC-type lipoprotein export system ATPase subunit